MRPFPKIFRLHQRVPYFSFATEWMLKAPKGSPFHIFRHCDIVQNSQFSFFHTLPQTGVTKSPFTILKTLQFLSLRYTSGFGRSQLVTKCFNPEVRDTKNRLNDVFR